LLITPFHTAGSFIDTGTSALVVPVHPSRSDTDRFDRARAGGARLDKLTYTYLGGWITRQQAEEAAGISGAEGRHQDALELQRKLIRIRHGEDPYDIYVRWKPLHG
jgi:hypothetical protein